MTKKQYSVYILASQRQGTLYIGVTNNLVRRIQEHKQDVIDGFTKKYGVHQLVWYEVADTPFAAITREKQLKKMESRVESAIDREAESRLERLVRRD